MNSWTNKRLSLLQALREGMLEKNAMRSGGSEAKLDSSLALRRAEEVAGAPAPKSEEACGGVHHALCSCHLDSVTCFGDYEWVNDILIVMDDGWVHPLAKTLPSC